MNEQEEKFNQVFKEDGGIFLTDYDFDIPYLFKTALDNAKLAHPNLPQINANIVSNYYLNAKAVYVLANEEYYIGINIGAILLIMDVFGKMLATKDILPNIGSVELETADIKTINCISDKFGASLDHEYATKNTIFPIDKLRFDVAMIYSTWAIEFLIFHEMGHIINGHLGLLSHQNFTPILTEFGYKLQENSIDSFSNQALEIDADDFAARTSFTKAKHFCKIKPRNDLEAFIYKDFNTFLSHWIFAMYSFSKLNGILDFNINEIIKYKYPPTSVRMSLIANTMIALANYTEGVDSKDRLHVIKQSICEAEEAFSKITFCNNNPDLFFNSLKMSKSYVDKLYQKRDELSNQLNDFNFYI